MEKHSHYYVIHGGECLGRFLFFFDAWLLAISLPSFSILSHAREGYLIINPPLSN